MSNLNQKFNNLNGVEVDRKTLEIMLKRADKEGNLIISKRIAKILHEYDDDRFVVEIINLVEPFGLNGVQHKGIAKDGLDDCGRLQPGFRYGANGQIIKTAQRKPRNCKTSCAEPTKKVPTTAKKIVAKKPNLKVKFQAAAQKRVDDKKIVISNGQKLTKKEILVKAEKAVKNIREKKNIKSTIAKVVEPKFTETPFDAELKAVKTELKTETNDKKREVLAKRGNKLISQIKRFDANAIETNAIPPNPFQRKTAKSNTEVINLKLSFIYTDEKRFQNRNELDQRIVTNIVKNFDSTQLDPIIVWFDPKAKKYYVLAGHHRFEALKQLKKEVAPVKIANYTEAEAIDFAKVKSNANRTLELPQERAKIYRELLKKGLSKTKVLEQAKELEGKNASYIVNLAALNPSGLTLQALNALANTPDKQNATIIEKIADWVGAARLQNEQLTNAHEKEIFDFLQDKDSSDRIRTKSEFLQKITAITGMFFDFETALNLKRFKYQTEGEKMYDNEFAALKKLIDTTTANRESLRERISNPAHPEYISPKSADYDQVIKALDTMVDKYAVELKQLQTKLNDLGRNKGYYTNQGSNQVGLFGNIKISTEDFKKMSVKQLRFFTLQFYNANLKGKKVAIKKHLKAVAFTSNAGRKIAKGGSMYKEKTAIIEKLETIIKNSTYNNWGSRKKTDPENIVGFLNFKSKVIIDGITKHVRIAISVTKNRETNLKNVEIGKKQNPNTIKDETEPSDGVKGFQKSDKFPAATKGTRQSALAYKNLSENKKTKTVPNHQTISQKSTLNAVQNPILPTNRQTLADKMANQNRVFENFKILNPEIAHFFGDLERKNKESVVVTLTGGQGSGKTRMSFQFINALAANYNVGHASIEMHPESRIYTDMVEQYIDSNCLANIENPEVKSIADLHQLIVNNDVIVIDSFQKMREIERGFEVDKDLRKKYHGKLFLVIFQQTTDGKMRGGSTSQFDADVVLFTEAFDDYRDNYVFADKNRYQTQPLNTLHYNVFDRKLMSNAAIEHEIEKQARHIFSFETN